MTKPSLLNQQKALIDHLSNPMKDDTSSKGLRIIAQNAREIRVQKIHRVLPKTLELLSAYKRELFDAFARAKLQVFSDAYSNASQFEEFLFDICNTSKTIPPFAVDVAKFELAAWRVQHVQPKTVEFLTWQGESYEPAAGAEILHLNFQILSVIVSSTPAEPFKHLTTLLVFPNPESHKPRVFEIDESSTGQPEMPLDRDHDTARKVNPFDQLVTMGFLSRK